MLEQFGLSNYENKAYLALLQMGMADAREISNESEVPYGRIYDTLDGLKSKRVINEIPGRPKQYTVVEPEIAIQNLMEEKQKSMRELQKMAEIATQDLSKMYERKPEDKLVWKVAIGDELYETYFDLLSEARREFYAYIEITGDEGDPSRSYFDQYLRVFRKMNMNNVKIKIILGIEDISIIEGLLEQIPEATQLLNIGEIKYTSRSYLGYSIIDKEKVLLKVVNPVNMDEMLAGVYLWKKDFASSLKKSFNELWDEAIPLKVGIQTPAE